MSRIFFVIKIRLEKFHKEKRKTGKHKSAAFSPPQTKIAERERERERDRKIVPEYFQKQERKSNTRIFKYLHPKHKSSKYSLRIKRKKTLKSN